MLLTSPTVVETLVLQRTQLRNKADRNFKSELYHLHDIITMGE